MEENFGSNPRYLRDMAKYFDRRAATYERHGMHQWLAAQAASIAKIQPGSRVLDVATGTGLAARTLLESAAGVSVVGVDISPGMLAMARQKMTAAIQFPVIRADAAALPFRDGIFDGVLCVASVAYIRDADAALTEWVRVCRPSGKITITTFARDGITSQRLIRVAAEQEGLEIDDPNEPLGSDAALTAFATRGGLREISVTHVTHEEPMRDPTSGWHNFLGSALAVDLNDTDGELVTRIYNRYIKAHKTMRERGEPNRRTSMILSGLVLPGHP